VTKTDGIDTQLRYDLVTQSAGEFLFSANTSFVNRFATQQTTTSTPINIVGSNSGQAPLRWRGRGSVSWMKAPWSVTFTARYTGHMSTNTTTPSPAFPTAFAWDGGRIPAFMRYDTQCSYEVPYGQTTRGWRNWINGTKWTVGILNALNDTPALITNGTGYYNTYDDPRQRFVYFQVKKSL
jgi:hypothetical protein